MHHLPTFPPPPQGGTVALELARQQQAAGQPLRSCVAISAALLPEQLAGQLLKGGDGGGKQQGGTAVLITHGSRDNGGRFDAIALGTQLLLCLCSKDLL